MPFREAFDCLWCGRPHRVRGTTDLEGWAALCPECLGRAGENDFLRFRLRAAIRERAAAADVASRDADAEMRTYYAARAPEYDDWYLRRGRYGRGPVHDLAWQIELDEATQWLDRLPLRGDIVELAAGTGWWSPLLAQKGELSISDAVPEPLDRARERLVAHGLRAHIHVRDAWEPAERQVDAVFCGFWLSHVPRARLAAFLDVVRGWLRPGGRFAFIDSRDDPASGAVDHPPVTGDGTAVRRLADGREFRIPKVFYEPDELRDALAVAGFQEPIVRATARFFVLGTAVAPAEPA
jgi:SAM-dependent methyltransferase